MPNPALNNPKLILAKKILAFLGIVILSAPTANAQVHCATSEVNARTNQRFPQNIANRQMLNAAIRSGLLNGAQAHAARGTDVLLGPDTSMVYHVPVVFHIIHEYGQEYLPDNVIYNKVASMNRVFSHTNVTDLTGLVPPYDGVIPGTGITYAGNAKIVFHLATIDPNGQPTNGITRRFSYLKDNAADEAKLDVWPTERYFNVWIVRGLSSLFANNSGYTYYPSNDPTMPYIDGTIVRYNYVDYQNLLEHETGHYFFLQHPWGDTNNPDVACGDDDVDDTPPTRGHLAGSGSARCNNGIAPPGAAIYDGACANGYAKTYTKTQFAALYKDTIAATINYPDTTNAQNIMDYTFCDKMFTYGQATRMRAAINSPVGSRNNLWNSINLISTGALASVPDLSPIADFSVNRNFFCANTANQNITFTNRSWRDTLTAASWEFGDGVVPATSASLTTATITNAMQPGWVTASLVAVSNTGRDSIAKSAVLYAADPTAIPASGYYQEFNAGGDLDKFPIFNFYNLDAYKWALHNRGYYDTTGIMYHNYDPRSVATYANNTQTPRGSFSDFYTRAFDLTGSDFGRATANLNFLSAGAFRTTSPSLMNDTLLISYSTNCGVTWRKLGALTQGDLGNNGYKPSAYYPQSMAEWKLNGFVLPAAAKTDKVFFRFRFISGTDNGATSGYDWGTGNNFFLDRLNLTGNQLGINQTELSATGMTVFPNPTNGMATILIKGGNNCLADIAVTDITGKLVYQTTTRLSNTVQTVAIPVAVIRTKGIYLVRAVVNGSVSIQKLVVN